MQAGAFALLGVGVVAAGTGAALFLTAPRPEGDAPPKPVVGVAFGPLGGSLHGSW